MLYPSNRRTEELRKIRENDRAVIWLGKNGSRNIES